MNVKRTKKVDVTMFIAKDKIATTVNMAIAMPHIAEIVIMVIVHIARQKRPDQGRWPYSLMDSSGG